jgi:hypothetical protein
MTSRERADDWFDTVYGYDENHGEISRKTLCQMLEEHEAFVRAEEREACATACEAVAEDSYGAAGDGALDCACQIRARGAK